MELDRKVVIITGATGGLGKEVVRLFLEAGATVVVSYRSRSKLAELRAGLPGLETRFAAFETDLTDEASVAALIDRALEKYAEIDVLANLAGGFTGGELVSETSTSRWDFMMNLNLKSVFLASKAVFPHMKKQKSGKIVNVSSKAALKGKAKAGPYSVSKAGVITLTESLADEGKDYNINVNAVLPSIIATEANMKRMPEADHNRWVTPREIAEAMLFLASPRAAGINGAAIAVYGKLL